MLYDKKRVSKNYNMLLKIIQLLKVKTKFLLPGSRGFGACFIVADRVHFLVVGRILGCAKLCSSWICSTVSEGFWSLLVDPLPNFEDQALSACRSFELLFRFFITEAPFPFRSKISFLGRFG